MSSVMNPSAAATAAASYLSERSFERTRYAFHTQAAPKAEWQVSAVRIEETLSSAYSVTVTLVTTSEDDAEILLGSSCTLLIVRRDAHRYLHGIVTRVEIGREETSVEPVTVTIVPALEALRHRVTARVFQDKTVPEVVDAILGEGLRGYQRKHELALRRRPYPTRELIVQYNESDLAFVERLLADEGIYYYFKQPEGLAADDTEILVLVDDKAETLPARLGEHGAELPLHTSTLPTYYWQGVTSLRRVRALGATKLSVRHYNWTNPEVWEKKSQSGSEERIDADPELRAVYEPDDLTLWQYRPERYTQFDTEEQTRLRWEQHASGRLRLQGEGNVIALCPGQKVVVKGHSREIDGEWLVTEVRASGRHSEGDGEADGEQLADYRNEFFCIPYQVPYRPARRPKPRASGIQSATVVGPDKKPTVAAGGDDIHTDEYGRIQVRFSWDRSPEGEQPGGVTTTCWLRVAQTWSGSGWGFVFVPRIGMEVLVSFLNGDPDRPIVTGCVYNGMNKPPKLPDEKTKSYIRTQSSPHGDGFNELCFEDRKDAEEIYVHAQRDMREVVEHDHATLVHHDQSNTVDNDQTEHIGANQSLTVVKNRTVLVKEDERRTVTGTETLEVTKETTETYHGGRTRTIEQWDQTKVVNAHKTTDVQGHYEVTVNDHFLVEHGSDTLYLSDELRANLTNAVRLEVGSNRIEITRSKITMHADQEISLQCGSASLTLKADGTIEAVGATKVALASATSNVSAEPSGVSVSGPKINSSAIGLHEVTGALIKIG